MAHVILVCAILTTDTHPLVLRIPKTRIAFQLVMVVIYPTVIQPLFNKLSPLPQGPLRTRIEALATRLKFPLTDLYVIDGSKRSAHSNAYFYGLPWSKHIVIYDTLISQSTPEEIEAVLGKIA